MAIHAIGPTSLTGVEAHVAEQAHRMTTPGPRGVQSRCHAWMPTPTPETATGVSMMSGPAKMQLAAATPASAS